MAKKTKPNAKRAARKNLARKSTGAKTRAAARGPNGHDTLRDVEQLLYRQAECLDGKRWQEFIELFTEDGTYWMPAAPEQTTGDGVPSIFWEDRNLMTVRLKRLTHPRAWSQKTAWGTNHVVGKRDHREGGREQRRSRRPLALPYDGVPQRHDPPFRRLVHSSPEEDEGWPSHQAPARRHGEREGRTNTCCRRGCE
jgi:Small subunit of phenylpropionate dioxygenase